MSVKVAALPVESATPFKPLRTLDVFAGCGGKPYSSAEPQKHTLVCVKHRSMGEGQGGCTSWRYFDADSHCLTHSLVTPPYGGV
jgi:hypothetical protein